MSSFQTEKHANPPFQISMRKASARVSSLFSRFAWLKSGLFWRTFFLLAFLVSGSMGAWFASFRLLEREPRASQVAGQVVSIVTITRAALTHSAADSRRELLLDLASNEGIRIYPLESTDLTEPPSDWLLMPLIETRVKEYLGKGTKFASVVNEVPGFWVSFNIDEDEYWLMLDRERIERTSGIQWAGWATITLLLSLVGAIFITRLVNQPLARLTEAAREIAKGKQPDALPEFGPTEVREANRSFNQMADDLNRVDADRAVILAGISHDLRTPIARMTLELEMAPLPSETRQAMQADLSQMDAIISQFLDYAKPAENLKLSPLDLGTVIAEAAETCGHMPDVAVKTRLSDGVIINGHATDLRRVFANLIENARRYGKKETADKAEIEIACFKDGDRAVVEFSDRGPGIPDSDLERIVRPFTRMDTARSQANGAGLGLAIVDRIIRRHHGTVKLMNRPQGGLTLRISVPAA
jgi:two-component system osmolarity sensor histidine kinase EnvZ